MERAPEFARNCSLATLVEQSVKVDWWIIMFLTLKRSTAEAVKSLCMYVCVYER